MEEAAVSVEAEEEVAEVAAVEMGTGGALTLGNYVVLFDQLVGRVCLLFWRLRDIAVILHQF